MDNKYISVVLDRAVKRRSIAFWRGLAFFLVFVVLTSIVSSLVGSFSDPGHGNFADADYSEGRIVVYPVIGDIVGGGYIHEENFKSFAHDDSVRGLILRVNSSGGSVGTSHALYSLVKDFATELPVVAVMYDLAESGGYMVSLPSTRIFARETTFTGSIGVVRTITNVEDVLEKVGVSVEVLKSGKHKATPNYFDKGSEEVAEYEQKVISSLADYFMDMVREDRDLSDEAVNYLRDGRVVFGLEAKELGLIDEFGGEKEAVEWLIDNYDGINENTVVETWSPNEDDVKQLLRDALGVTSDVLGFAGGVANRLISGYKGAPEFSN